MECFGFSISVRISQKNVRVIPPASYEIEPRKITKQNLGCVRRRMVLETSKKVVEFLGDNRDSLPASRFGSKNSVERVLGE